ncbi:MAG: hypothetical protein N2444_09485, partial [Methylocystis sp.]|nr:hypothetical protein [Methylocystis sp.]
MNTQTTELRLRGRSVRAPMRHIQGRQVVVTGRFLKIASIMDEEWLEGEPVNDSRAFVAELRKCGLHADIFTFCEPIGGGIATHDFPHEPENAAVIRTEAFKEWWEGLPQEARKNTRRATKRGVIVKPAVLNDELVAGIKRIYDESPLRQGRRFWHYGKELEAIRRENATYIERSEFLGAYFQDELIGFIKYVFVGDSARIMQILS